MVDLKRGKIQKLPWYFCGCNDAEKHHPDYSQPLLVVWLCRKCHLVTHQHELVSDDGRVEHLALQWDKQRKRGVKRLKEVSKHQREARLQAKKIRDAERKNMNAA